MIYTQKIQEAINVAETAHKGQKRIDGTANKDIPYIVHPLSVAIILARVEASEDTIIAGILHDVVEDTKVTLKDIEKQFGKHVADIVNEVTERGDLSWDERKRLQLDGIKRMSRDGLLVRSADFLNNTRDTLYKYQSDGDSWFNKINGIPKEKRLKYWSTTLEELKKAWPKNPLIPELEDVLNKLHE
jgi:(p)ppGpp synthase/HD superfamily hydrolase